ncbi:MAG: hypothetical protein ACE37K_13160 [Planctomycetota bacterium]
MPAIAQYRDSFWNRVTTGMPSARPNAISRHGPNTLGCTVRPASPGRIDSTVWLFGNVKYVAIEIHAIQPMPNTTVRM